MSVSLTPINDPDGDSFLDCTNDAWEKMVKAAKDVAPWDGIHFPGRTFTPEELRSIAANIPEEYKVYGWEGVLEELAQAGGAILS
jgi:hypothetical protein